MAKPYGFTIMHMDTPIVHISIDENRRLTSEQLAPWTLGIPSSLGPDRINYRILDEWLETRVPDKRRDDIDHILARYNLKSFIPIKMCEKSHGRNMSDFIWIRFDGEELTFNDIRLR